jgi:hypothetical protein
MSPTNPYSPSSPLQIAGRFYPFNIETGISLVGCQLYIRETPNLSNACLEAQPAQDSVRQVRLGAGCGLVGIVKSVLRVRTLVS